MFNVLKFNKINITAIITCFMLITVLVFGCVTFAHAEVTNSYIYGEEAFNYANSSEQHKFILCFRNKDSYITWFITNYTDKVALIKREDDGICYFDLYTNPFSNNVKVLSVSSYLKDNNFKTGVGSTYSFESSIKGLSGLTFDSYGVSNGDVVSVGVPVFSNIDDLSTYLQTGEINNPIYDNRSVEYDSSIEIPLMAQCQVNGDKFLFNCKQSEPHNDYKLQISASISLTPVYSNLTSKQYADTQQIYTSSKSEIGKYDNFDTTFNVSFSSKDLLNGLDTSRSALGFKEFYNGYNILLPYKESVLSKIYFYARNVSGVKCSNWVKVTYDLITETSSYEEVESVAGSDVPSDTKKDSSEYYPDDYIYNDNEPAQDSNSSGIIGYIKSGLGLVGNNSIIALIGNTFSFLPKELTTLLLFGGALLVAAGIIKVVTR